MPSSMQRQGLHQRGARVPWPYREELLGSGPATALQRISSPPRAPSLKPELDTGHHPKTGTQNQGARVPLIQGQVARAWARRCFAVQLSLSTGPVPKTGTVWVAASSATLGKSLGL